ncbi:MAG: hypothetical protein K2N20_02925 [Helicobacter sp.]|nr:hypothetical protein [Helicobacter sp.]
MLKILLGLVAIAAILWFVRRLSHHDGLNTLLRAGEIVVFIVLVGGIAFWFFGDIEQKSAKKVSDKVLAFEQGRTLVCGAQKVSNQTHNLSHGTLVFVGKTDENRGSKVELRGCEIEMAE